MNESIEQYDLADRIRELVVGHRIVAAGENFLALDNGTKLEVEGSSDCCAWGDATFGELADSVNVITQVTSKSDDENEAAQVFLLTDVGTALNIDQSWDSSNGYYFYGLHLTVKGSND